MIDYRVLKSAFAIGFNVCRNGIQQRLNSWQDGVSGTNCPIQPGTNWTYVFQTKDQIGSFFYFPSINFQKAGGGFGPIRINNRIAINVPFPKPEAEFDLLIGDWYQESYKVKEKKINSTSGTNSLHKLIIMLSHFDYGLQLWQEIRSKMKKMQWAYFNPPDWMLMNGKVSLMNPNTTEHESFTVTKGKHRWKEMSAAAELCCGLRPEALGPTLCRNLLNLYEIDILALIILQDLLFLSS